MHPQFLWSPSFSENFNSMILNYKDYLFKKICRVSSGVAFDNTSHELPVTYPSETASSMAMAINETV